MKLKIMYKYFYFLLLVVSYSASAQPTSLQNPFSQDPGGLSTESGTVEVVAISDMPTVTDAQKSVLLAREKLVQTTFTSPLPFSKSQRRVF